MVLYSIVQYYTVLYSIGFCIDCFIASVLFIVFLSIVNVVLILLNMMCNISFRNTVVMFKSLNAEQLEIHSSGSTYAQLMIRSVQQSLSKHISKVAVFH